MVLLIVSTSSSIRISFYSMVIKFSLLFHPKLFGFKFNIMFLKCEIIQKFMQKSSSFLSLLVKVNPHPTKRVYCSVTNKCFLLNKINKWKIIIKHTHTHTPTNKQKQNKTKCYWSTLRNWEIVTLFYAPRLLLLCSPKTRNVTKTKHLINVGET